MTILQAARCDKCDKVSYGPRLIGWVEVEYRITTSVANGNDDSQVRHSDAAWTTELCGECAKAFLAVVDHPTETKEA